MRRMLALLVYFWALAREGVRWPRAVSLTAITLLLSCHTSGPAIVPPEPGGSATPALPPATQMDFPPMNIYYEWWQQVEACAELPGDMTRIRWTVANRSYLALVSDSTHLLLAMYRPKEQQILIGLVWVADPNVIRHEMLHAILDQHGLLKDDDQHPEQYFIHDCGPLLGHPPS